jgi:gas vesicle protein
MTEKQRNKAFVVPLLAGLAGAGLALLYAPRSGRETREKIHETAQDVQRDVSHSLESARQQVHEGINQAKEITSKVAETIKSRRRHKDVDELTNDIPTASSWDQEV